MKLKEMFEKILWFRTLKSLITLKAPLRLITTDFTPKFNFIAKIITFQLLNVLVKLNLQVILKWG